MGEYSNSKNWRCPEHFWKSGNLVILLSRKNICIWQKCVSSILKGEEIGLKGYIPSISVFPTRPVVTQATILHVGLWVQIQNKSARNWISKYMQEIRSWVPVLYSFLLIFFYNFLNLTLLNNVVRRGSQWTKS